MNNTRIAGQKIDTNGALSAPVHGYIFFTQFPSHFSFLISGRDFYL